ncbi:MerR family transcriptional regulator [Amycolatopsis jejuensis]|uniref:MerR family transcriptional regulator n=1 Tax=Amycolatopsis jejuensis TaxID=330084 RepID=UPI00052703B4|nr:MerR family transcriptional regulator [Amycolatopsis jejuensis]
MKSTELTIGEVADRFGLATHVLRHWESVGLLAPARSAASRRRYSADDLIRIAVILQAKEIGFPLGDIRELLTAREPGQRAGLLQRRRAEVTAWIAAAQASLEMLDCALACTHDDLAACPHFQAAVTARVKHPPADPSTPPAPPAPPTGRRRSGT